MIWIVGIVAGLAIVTLLCAFFRDLGYKAGSRDGHQIGYERGKAEAHEWWLTAEEQIVGEQQKMWRKI